MQKMVVIQTAFIGDVVLATALIESLHQQFPVASIDIVVRKGNETLFANHPFIEEVIVWDKKNNKYFNWLQVLKKLRSKKYDLLINVQRFAATGLWTVLAKAKITIGFDKNPFSFLFSHTVKHLLTSESMHEINRNHALLESLGVVPASKPKLYPAPIDFEKVKSLQDEKYITIAAASVWFTKQFPVSAWVSFINELPFKGPIYIVGGSGDKLIGEEIIKQHVAAAKSAGVVAKNLMNIAGQLNFLASAALQQKAVLNYVNDSAPLHFCSAVDAPVVAIYCSTILAFGFGPLSSSSVVVETSQTLTCRPCGLHGKKDCPLGHFNCAHSIQNAQLIAPLLQVTQH